MCQHKNVLTALMCGMVSLSLPACLDIPSKTNTDRLEITQSAQENTYPVSSFGPAEIKSLADTYKDTAASDLILSVTYDPSVRGAEVQARRDLDRIVESFYQNGVSSLKADTLPVPSSGNARQVLVSYQGLQAQAPSHCGLIPGINNTQVTQEEMQAPDDYKYGCSVEAMIAKQASPRDLIGRKEMGPYDAARASGQLESYRKGEEFKPLEGKTASEKQ